MSLDDIKTLNISMIVNNRYRDKLCKFIVDFIMDKYVMPEVPILHNYEINNYELPSGYYSHLGSAVEFFAKIKIGARVYELEKGFMDCFESPIRFDDIEKLSLAERSLLCVINHGAMQMGKQTKKEFHEYCKIPMLLEKIEEFGNNLIKLLQKYNWSTSTTPFFSAYLTDKIRVNGQGDLMFGGTLIDSKVHKGHKIIREDIIQQLLYYEVSEIAEDRIVRQGGFCHNPKIDSLRIMNPVYNVDFEIPIIKKQKQLVLEVVNAK